MAPVPTVEGGGERKGVREKGIGYNFKFEKFRDTKIIFFFCKDRLAYGGRHDSLPP